MNWSKVGNWIKDNAGPGAALVGSLVTGSLPGAIAAGSALISGATGTDDPRKALEILKNNPEAMVKLKELYYKNEESVRDHLQEMTKLKLEDEQKSHETTQKTIINGDNSQDNFVRWTRPGQSWLSLFAAFVYVFSSDKPDTMILGALLTLPWAYAGLRQIGKGVDSIASAAAIRKISSK